MLLFSTILSIKKSVTKDDFIKLVLEWNQQSKYKENIVPGIEWNGERNVRYGNDNLWLDIQEYRNGNTIAVRYEKAEDDGIVWDTDYVMNFNDMKMAISLERGFSESIERVDTSFSPPLLIKMLIDKGYLEDDCGLPISYEPIVISDDNLKLLVNVINEDITYEKPVVYVSKTFYGDDPIDVDTLAYKLKGLAHVFVQKGGWINSDLKEQCGGKNEYYGAVGIYYPTPAFKHRYWLYKKYTGRNDKLMNNIFHAVVQYTNYKKIDLMYTWQGVNNRLLLDRIDTQKTKRKSAEMETEELIRLIDSVDEDIRNYQEQNEKLMKEIERLRRENNVLEIKLSSIEKEPILYFGNEEEYFPGEIRDIVIDAISDKIKGLEDGTRRLDILNDIIANNEYSGLADERVQIIKNALKGYKNINGTLKSALDSVGIEMSEDGKHCKLTYYGDARYLITMGKTPGSDRSGTNLAQDIIKKML